MKNKKLVLTFGLLTAIVAGGFALAIQMSNKIQAAEIGGVTTIPRQNLKVAFIGDQGITPDAKAVLQLIRDEKADMVLHQGDLGYGNESSSQSVTDWDNQVNNVLGPDFPYFASIGNHDVGQWAGYQLKLQERLNRVTGASCTGDLGVQSECYYEGLHFLLVGPGTMGIGHDIYIRDRLAADNSLWSICSWHKNQKKMQVGNKLDEAGWEVYEECRMGGGIVATGHEHSYSRTHLINDFDALSGPSVAGTIEPLVISKGATIGFVSGLGGMSIRSQTQPSDVWWASIYTSTQGAASGALFCAFNVNGQPDRADCYFKDINGNVQDQFTLQSNVETLLGNLPPLVNAGVDKSTVSNTVVSLDAAVTDDGPSITAVWMKESGPGNVVFTNASAIDTGVSFLIPGTYVLRLAATDGEFSVFDEAKITVLSPQPTPPTNLMASSTGQTVDVSWTAAEDLELGIVSYRIYRDIVSGGAKTLLAEIPNTQLAYSDSDTNPNTTYYYDVSAVNGLGFEGVRSNEASALTGDDVPAAPVNLAASGLDQHIALNWDDNAEGDIVGYNVYRSNTAAGPYIVITVTPVPTSTYTDTDLTNGTAYYYVVTAVDAGSNESEYSTEASGVPTDIDPTLVAHWKFDEGSGITAFDSGSNSNNGTLINNPVWVNGVNGILGNALQFTAAQQQSVFVNHSESLNFASSSFSIAFWVNYTDALDVDILRKGSTNTASSWYKVEIPAVTQKVSFNLQTLSTSTTVTTPATYNDGQWHHVAAIRDTLGGLMKLYVDGILAVSAADPGGSVSNSANLTIGSKDTLDDDFMDGIIDEVSLYNRVLSEQEITDLYAAGVDTTLPTAPASLSAAPSGENVELFWTGANDSETGISAYRIYRDTVAGGIKSLLAEVPDTQLNYTDTATIANTTYYYEVSAVNGVGLEGTKSIEASALTGDNPPAAPTGLIAGAGDQQVTLDWSNNVESDLAGYHVYRATLSGGPYTNITASAVLPSTYTDTTVSNDTEYFYTVTAIDAGANESVFSSEVSATPTAVILTSVQAVRVSGGSDDSEECYASGKIDINSSDLEFTQGTSNCTVGEGVQQVGMRFQNILIPQGATIANASIQFTADEADSDATSVTFFGEATDNASVFTKGTFDISNRPTTFSSVAWNNIPAWNIVGEAGSNQKTPNLASIIQEIVNRPGWTSGNSISIIVTGLGHRTAESYNGSSSQAPLLDLEWE